MNRGPSTLGRISKYCAKRVTGQVTEGEGVISNIVVWLRGACLKFLSVILNPSLDLTICENFILCDVPFFDVISPTRKKAWKASENMALSMVAK